MTTRAPMIASVLGLLSAAGLSACDKTAKQTTDAPASTGSVATQDGDCLHAEGCCGGHTAGDGSCGAAKAEAAKGPGQEAAGDPRRFTWTIAPGEFAEINVELGDGATMSATFESDASVSWNVHSHPGDTPKIHAEGNEAKGAPAFTAGEGGLYSYLWMNKGAQAVELVVELRIQGTGRVHSTHPQ